VSIPINVYSSNLTFLFLPDGIGLNETIIAAVFAKPDNHFFLFRTTKKARTIKPNKMSYFRQSKTGLKLISETVGRLA
jgi:hypothetical protein